MKFLSTFIIAFYFFLSLVLSQANYLPQVPQNSLVSLSSSFFNMSQGSFSCKTIPVNDLNNDFLREVLFSCPTIEQVFLVDVTNQNIFQVYNGVTGVIMEGFGTSIANLGDINNNGLDDFAVGAPSYSGQSVTGAIRVFDIGGTQIYSVFGTSGYGLGYTIENIGDIDNDGINDFISGGVEVVYAFSGSTGQLIYQVNYPLFGVSGFGVLSLANLGDIDNDGINDFAVGAPMATVSNIINLGAVFVFSGQNGSLIGTISPNNAIGNFGVRVSAANLDGDAIKDILIGATFLNNLSGSVLAYSGANFSLIAEFNVTNSTFFGGNLKSGDFNKDGYSDLIAGSNYLGPLRVYFGNNKGVLDIGSASSSIAELHIEDFNYDGFDDIFYSDYNNGFNIYSLGGVYLYGLGYNQMTAIWTSQPNTNPLFPASGVFTISGGLPNALGYVISSYNLTNTVLPSGRVILIDYNSLNLFNVIPFYFDSSGTANITAGIQNSNIEGLAMYFQAFLKIPGMPYENGLYSNGVKIVFVR